MILTNNQKHLPKDIDKSKIYRIPHTKLLELLLVYGNTLTTEDPEEVLKDEIFNSYKITYRKGIYIECNLDYWTLWLER